MNFINNISINYDFIITGKKTIHLRKLFHQQLTVDSGQWSVVSGQWSVVSDQQKTKTVISDQ